MEPLNAQPTVVLLRGLSREQRHWGDFPAILQKQLPQHQVICLDTLGNGERFQQQSPLCISLYCQDILNQLAKQKIENAILVGLSLGGMVALASLAAHSSQVDKVSQVIAINTSSRYSWPWQRFALLPFCKGLLSAKRYPDCSKMEHTILTLTSLLHKQDLNVLKYWSELRQQAPTSITNSLRQIIAAARFKPSIDMLVGKPVSFIYAKQDQLVNPKCTLALAKALKAATYVIDQAGHDVALDQPQVLANTLANIINSGNKN
ncbi:alpha/beta fold hydrolase [Motilimonas sp. KMU-193]|uniref:alpha/beta fold hydrolase n=1 Tax=Motilimonas sp. KMU-193 TaxID=3388668 RepID=UPI00396B0178